MASKTLKRFESRQWAVKAVEDLYYPQQLLTNLIPHPLICRVKIWLKRTYRRGRPQINQSRKLKSKSAYIVGEIISIIRGNKADNLWQIWEECQIRCTQKAKCNNWKSQIKVIFKAKRLQYRCCLEMAISNTTFSTVKVKNRAKLQRKNSLTKRISIGYFLNKA